MTKFDFDTLKSLCKSMFDHWRKAGKTDANSPNPEFQFSRWGKQPQIIICFLAAASTQRDHCLLFWEYFFTCLVQVEVPSFWSPLVLLLLLSIIKWLSILCCISWVSAYISYLHYYMLCHSYFVIFGLLYHLHILGWSFARVWGIFRVRDITFQGLWGIMKGYEAKIKL